MRHPTKKAKKTKQKLLEAYCCLPLLQRATSVVIITVWYSSCPKKKKVLGFSVDLTFQENPLLNEDKHPTGKTHETLASERTVWWRHVTQVSCTGRTEAQAAKLDYLHCPRCPQFTNAEHMNKNSPNFLEMLLKKVIWDSESLCLFREREMWQPTNTEECDDDLFMTEMIPTGHQRQRWGERDRVILGF